ncbi:MAG TPA: chemotaxis protein CheB [Bryobacteraceae bacterium]
MKREKRPASLPPRSKPTVVGIGASAGGLAALKTFFEHVPADSGLAFVVVVHLSPEHPSHLADLLQPHTHFSVQQVTETTQLEPNRVYIIPPNANLSAIDTHLRLSKLEKQRRERAPIDHFFRTLASTHDGDGVGVVLTGTGSDGTLGIKDIKAKGGLVIVQDPNEAEYDGMPQSAIATGLVDRILPVAEIPDSILRYDRTAPRVEVPDDGSEAAQAERLLLPKIFAHLRARTDRDFSRYKRSTILRRIARRMQLNYLEDLKGYLDRLREQPEEARALADDFLITVTNFFRDPEVFEKLEQEVIPRLFEGKGAKDVVRVWSVGCATGEEAYTLAMLLVEAAERREAPQQIQIFASDLHSRSLERAREGFYPGDIETDVSSERLKRFFRKEAGGYRVQKELRDLVVFAPHNLLGDPPFSRLDLISCRNLLIYLQRDVQRDVIELFHYALNPEGALLLGSSETADAADLFRTEDKKLCFYRKRNVPAPEMHLPVFPRAPHHLPSEPAQRLEDISEPLAYGILHQRMLELAASPSVLISPDNKLVHLSEDAGRYLVHPGGELTAGVFKLMREELRIELRALLQMVREKNKPADSSPIPIEFNGRRRTVVMHVRPALDREHEKFVLILFEEQEARTSAKRPARGKRAADKNPEERRVEELENEISVARQRLQAIIEEYETTQEEMKASNEEMQSTNEELRSTMEELETSKEELQSINEELQTVNQENRHKMEELAQLSSDLQNLLTATDIATLFLDRELRILRFTPRVEDLFNVRLTDRGRPIFDLTHRLGYDELRKDADSVLSRLVPIEREVRDENGSWYLARVLPYRSTDDRIQGVVITFTDITTRKMAEEALRVSEDRLRQIINVEGVGVLIFDNAGTLIESNEAFTQMSGYTRDDIALGRISRNSLTPPEYVAATDRELLKLAKTGHIGPYEKEYFRKDGSRCWMIFAGASLGGGTVVEYCIDVMDRKKAEKVLLAQERSLLIANEALSQANADLKVFALAASHDLNAPLRTMSIYSQVLIKAFHEGHGPEAERAAGVIIECAGRMGRLLSDLQEYAELSNDRSDAGELIDLNAAVRKAGDDLKGMIEEANAEITYDPLPAVRGRETSFIQLFQNLIENSIKYRNERTPKIRISAERAGEQWRLAVADNGIGIDRRFHEGIFDPFKRLHGKEIPGTGIGLAICRRIVERYGGRIWVESENGRGSTFYMTFPALERMVAGNADGR